MLHGDPFRAAFVAATTGDDAPPGGDDVRLLADDALGVRDVAAWERLRRLLLVRGTVAAHEAAVLDAIWDDACQSARAVGDLGHGDEEEDDDDDDGDNGDRRRRPPPRRRRRRRPPILTFAAFQRRLMALYAKPGADAIEGALCRLEDGAETLAGTFAAWDVASLNEIQLRELMVAVDRLDVQSARLAADAAARVAHQTQALSLQPVQTLFWDEVGGPARLEEAVLSRAAPTALKYQAEMSAQINRRCRDNRIATIRGVYFAAKNADGSPRPQPLDDPYGHAGRCADGVTCSLALSAASAGRDRVELVSVPRSGASGQAMQQILTSFEVHRQLSLSPRFPQVLGCDDTSDQKFIHYMYDYAHRSAEAPITARELCTNGGPLPPSSPLFRFLVSEILEAFVELDERCTFGLRGRLTAENIIVAEAGTAVRVARLPLGDELSSFSNGQDVALFHARREASLVHAFGDIVAELLLGSPGAAGHAPPTLAAGGRRGRDVGTAPAVYDREACRAGVHACPGEGFTLMLAADASAGYVWDTPVIINDDRSTVSIVRFQGMEPKAAAAAAAGGAGGSAGMTIFSIEFAAVQTGGCTLRLTRKRPWDTSVAQEEALTVHVSVHEAGMDPSYGAVVRACTEGFRERLEGLERRARRQAGAAAGGGGGAGGGGAGLLGPEAEAEAAKRRLREPWQRQPTLRELRRHRLLSCAAAGDTPDVDTLITAFERHVEDVF